MKITDEEWKKFQQIPDPSPFSHRHWLDHLMEKRFAKVWEEGYEAAERDAAQRDACNKSGGPVSDCDCQVLTPNPYEEN